MIDDSPPALRGLHTPLAAHPHRLSGVHSPLKRVPCYHNDSPDRNNTLVTVTESGYLRIELDTGTVICIGEDGVQDAASSNASPRPLGMKWGDVQVGPAIGKGGLATVYTAVHLPTQTEYALKVIRIEGAVVKNVVQQVTTGSGAVDDARCCLCVAYLSGGKAAPELVWSWGMLLLMQWSGQLHRYCLLSPF